MKNKWDYPLLFRESVKDICGIPEYFHDFSIIL